MSNSTQLQEPRLSRRTTTPARNLLALCLTVVSAVSIAQSNANAAPAVVGDYELDGKSDVAAGFIDPVLKNTSYIARLSSGQTSPYYTWPLQASAFVTGRWYSDKKTYPGIVYVRDRAKPLEWYIKNPQGTDNFFAFGLPGDSIPNTAYDLDGDGITDPVVVRNGVPGYWDGFKLWYVALSGSAQIYETVFGLKDDQVFIGQEPDGSGKLYVLRNGFVWFGRKLLGTDVSVVQWGLAGDIPLAPMVMDGQASHIIVRKVGAFEYGYVRRADGTTKVVTLGGASSVPFVANFFGQGNDFGYFDRTVATPNVIFGARLPGGTFLPFPFGVTLNVIIAPNGQVFQPARQTPEEDQPASNSGCRNVVSISSLTNVLYKPVNEHGGRGPSLLVQNSGERTGKSKVEIRDANCKAIASLGLYATDQPYGARYYSRSGGSGHSAEQLLSLARRAGQSYILIEGRNKWIKINNPTQRQGDVHD